MSLPLPAGAGVAGPRPDRRVRSLPASLLCGLGLLTAFLLCAWPPPAGAAPIPNQDTYVTDGTVSALATDSAGRQYLGGTFAFVGPRTGHGLELTTTDDQTAAGFPDVAGGSIDAVAPDGSGGWFIGGSFLYVGGVQRSQLAHILADGSVDPTWSPNLNAAVETIAVDGGYVYFGGAFTFANGSTVRHHIARTPTTGDGTVDPDWDPDAGGDVLAIAVAGSNVYFGGAFTTVNGGAGRNRIARTSTSPSSDGTVDPWNPNANNTVRTIAVLTPEVYFGGDFTLVNGSTRNHVAKVRTATGTIQPWNPDANDSVRAIAVSGPDVYLGGEFTQVNGTTVRNHIARTLTNGVGTVDADWNPNAGSGVFAITVTGGDVYLGGRFTSINGSTARNFVARTPEAGFGTADATWNPNAGGTVRALGASPGHVYVGGDFASAGRNLQARSNIARLNPDGTLDPTWDPGADDIVEAIAVSGSDVYFGGGFNTVNHGSTVRHGMAKTSTAGNGTVDPAWDPDTGAVKTIAVSGSDVYFGGLFTTVNGSTTRYYVARTPATGTGTVDAWNPDPDGPVMAIVASGADVYLGGFFNSLNGSTARNHLARVSTTGTGIVDPTWAPEVSGVVYTIAVANSEVFFGGYFSLVNGSTPRNSIAKTPTTGDGTVDPDWDPDADGAVDTLAVAGSDVYFGGSFSTVKGFTTYRHHLARTPTTGTGVVDPTWDPDAEYAVLALAASGPQVLVGGNFSTLGGYSTQGVASLAGPPALSVSPASADFDSWMLGTASPAQTFTVVNTGDAPLRVGTPAVSGPDAGQFALAPGSSCENATLAIDAACTAAVTFAPTTAGAKAARLDLPSDGAGADHVTLTGTGVAGPGPGPVPPGPAPPGPAPPGPTPPGPATLTLSGLSLSNRVFRAGARNTPVHSAGATGTTVRYRLSRNANVKIRFNKITARAPRRGYVPARILYRSAGRLGGRAGANAVRFTARVAGTTLTPGRWRITITAGEGAATTRPQTTTLTVLAG